MWALTDPGEMAMKRSEKLLAAGLASILAGICPNVTVAAEGGVVAQDLMNVKASGQVTARWLREPESYTLRVMVERSKPGPRAITSASTQQKETQPATAAQQGGDRSSYFIGNTIANLRGLDPVFGCNRTLTVVDGRRTLPNSVGRVPPVLPYDPKAKQPRVEVWLLKADGTHIPSADYSCASYPASTEAICEYAAADGSQAVAAAIRIDDEYYIEKLHPLEPKAAP